MGTSKKLIGVRAIEAMQPGDTVWDSRVVGFGARRQKGDGVSYVLRFRDAGGKPTWRTIGRHSSPWTPDSARAEAQRLLGDLAQGVDLRKTKAVVSVGMTVAELCAVYMQAAEAGLVLGKRGTPKKASTIATDYSRITGHIDFLLGERPVAELKRHDLNRFVTDVIEGKSARVEKTGLRGKRVVTGGRGAATRTQGLLGAILQWGLDQGHLSENPAVRIRRPADGKRETRLKATDYARLGRVLNTEGIHHNATQAILLLALSGARLSEITGLRWSEVDTKRNRLTLGDSKTGRSIRSISTHAAVVLIHLKHDRSPFVFPSPNNPALAHGGMEKAIRRVLDQAGVSGLTPHILRHGFGSVGANLGFGRDLIGALLGHSPGGVTSRYMHFSHKVTHDAADVICSKIVSMMDFDVFKDGLYP